jgi:hypothetical protein
MRPDFAYPDEGFTILPHTQQRIKTSKIKLLTLGILIALPVSKIAPSGRGYGPRNFSRADAYRHGTEKTLGVADVYFGAGRS